MKSLLNKSLLLGAVVMPLWINNALATTTPSCPPWTQMATIINNTPWDMQGGASSGNTMSVQVAGPSSINKGEEGIFTFTGYACANVGSTVQMVYTVQQGNSNVMSSCTIDANNEPNSIALNCFPGNSFTIYNEPENIFIIDAATSSS